MRWFLGGKFGQYIFFESVPQIIFGTLVFIFILLMSQILRLTEYLLVHGISIEILLNVVLYLCLSLLPALFPMATLFGILFTYNRLSLNSEITAVYSFGAKPFELMRPALFISLIMVVLSAQASFVWAPWGNRQFELLISQVGESKAALALKEGTFSEGFFDMVIYVNQIDPKTQELSDIFIYDDHSGDVPMTVIAKRGRVLNAEGQTLVLQLYDGDIYRTSVQHTRVHFDSFSVKLQQAALHENKKETPPSLSLEQIRAKLETNPPQDEKRMLEIEFHRRIAITFLCLIFGVLGMSLGTQIQLRKKSHAFVICLSTIVLYWVCYLGCESLARESAAPVALLIWLPNFIFGGFLFYRLRKLWQM